jgi:hypothetical protein
MSHRPSSSPITSTFHREFGLRRLKRFRGVGFLAACLFVLSLMSCTNSRKSPAANGTPPVQMHLASAQVGALTAPGRVTHIVLPNESLIGCKAPSCYQVLPDASSDVSAVYPWQVILDFNQPAIIGLIALYDQPTTIDDVQAALDEHYEKWALADFRKGPVRLWRVDPPEKFAIQLATNGDGMVQLIYLSYGAKHPTSDQAAARALRECKDGKVGAFGCGLLKNALSSQ